LWLQPQEKIACGLTKFFTPSGGSVAPGHRPHEKTSDATVLQASVLATGGIFDGALTTVNFIVYFQ